MGSWEDIKRTFNIPNTQKKTFTLVNKALGSRFSGKYLNAKQFIEQIHWKDGKMLNEFSSQQIYSLHNQKMDIFDRINQLWGFEWSHTRWLFILDMFWHSHVKPKKVYFRWMLFL